MTEPLAIGKSGPSLSNSPFLHYHHSTTLAQLKVLEPRFTQPQFDLAPASASSSLQKGHRAEQNSVRIPTNYCRRKRNPSRPQKRECRSKSCEVGSQYQRRVSTTTHQVRTKNQTKYHQKSTHVLSCLCGYKVAK